MRKYPVIVLASLLLFHSSAHAWWWWVLRPIVVVRTGAMVVGTVLKSGTKVAGLIGTAALTTFTVDAMAKAIENGESSVKVKICSEYHENDEEILVIYPSTYKHCPTSDVKPKVATVKFSSYIFNALRNGEVISDAKGCPENNKIVIYSKDITSCSTKNSEPFPINLSTLSIGR